MPKKSKSQTRPLPPPSYYQHSPIDIVGSIAAVLPPIEFHYEEMAIGDLAPGPAGHGYNVAIQGNAGFVRLGEKTAKLVQLHFHAKSEHHVCGCEFPMELHLVHEIANPTTGSTLLVVGVFFNVESKRKANDASMANASLFQTLLFLQKAKSASTFNPKNLLPSDPLGYYGYYRYEGSLTTCDLDEKVSWIVLRQPLCAIKADVAPLIAAATHKDLPIQNLNRRFILRNF